MTSAVAVAPQGGGGNSALAEKLPRPAALTLSLAGNYLELENGLGGEREEARKGSRPSVSATTTVVYTNDLSEAAVGEDDDDGLDYGDTIFLKEPLPAGRLTLSTFEASEASRRPPTSVSSTPADRLIPTTPSSSPLWPGGDFAYYLDEEDDSDLTEATPLATTSLRPLIQPKRHQPAAADQLSRSQPAADQLSRSQPAADQLSRSQPVADQLSRSQPVPAQLSQPLLPVQQWADSDPDFQQLGMA